jgi:hypothetical protein
MSGAVGTLAVAFQQEHEGTHDHPELAAQRETDITNALATVRRELEQLEAVRRVTA